MSDSKQWALDALQTANTIYEPNERGGFIQAMDFLVWSLECCLIWYLAARFVAA
jgi:hypothetical protein